MQFSGAFFMGEQHMHIQTKNKISRPFGYAYLLKRSLRY